MSKTVKYVTKRELIKLNRRAIKNGYDQQLEPTLLERIPSYKYPVNRLPIFEQHSLAQMMVLLPKPEALEGFDIAAKDNMCWAYLNLRESDYEALPTIETAGAK